MCQLNGDLSNLASRTTFSGAARCKEACSWGFETGVSGLLRFAAFRLDCFFWSVFATGKTSTHASHSQLPVALCEMTRLVWCFGPEAKGATSTCSLRPVNPPQDGAVHAKEVWMQYWVFSSIICISLLKVGFAKRPAWYARSNCSCRCGVVRRLRLTA